MDSLPPPDGPAASSPLSPNPRRPLTRALSPDLPSRDALYLFANFSSYMRSPGEGAEGIASHKDFHDTVRLLEHARHLASLPHTNVHVLHLKYRFQSATDAARSPYASGDYRRPINYHDTLGRLRNPVPQPFAVLQDPVLKIDLKENGVFQPLPAEAIFTHIAKACRPPPRIIVISYVGSRSTCNHLSSIAKWARTSSPPIYVFSPLETRVRERQTLPEALGCAVPISMYAAPAGPPGPHTALDHARLSEPPARPESPASPAAARARASPASPASSPPVAVLSVRPSAEAGGPGGGTAADDAAERLPLWSLAPGVGMLQGSTAASVGVKLDDFLAVNMALPDDAEAGEPGVAAVDARDCRALKATLPADAVHLSAKAVTLAQIVEPLVRPSSTAPPAVKVPHPDHVVAQALVPEPKGQSWSTPTAKVAGWQKGRRELMEDVVHEISERLGPVGSTEPVCSSLQAVVQALLLM